MIGSRLWGRRIGVAGTSAIVLGLIAVVLWTFAISWHPSDKDYSFQGIDISEDQGLIHWPTIQADGVDFAYMRATMGASGRDTQFPVSWADAYAWNMRRGAIHIWSFCRLAIDQANNFNTTVPRVGDALPTAVYIDFAPDCTSRPDRAVVIAEVRRFVSMVQAHTGKAVMLKITEPVEAKYRLSAGIDSPLWSMQNFFPPNYSARPWRMWQASDMRRIDGLSGPIRWSVVTP